jgi:hypothetical protein
LAISTGDPGRQKTTEMTMGRGLWVLPLALVFCATSAWAQGKPKKEADAEEQNEKEGDEPTGGMMEDPGRDPAETETFEDEGRFVPGRKEKKPKKETSRPLTTDSYR